MTGFKTVILELTINEAIIVKDSIANSLPSKENEMIVFMLYNRILNKIKEATDKNGSL